ncbi:MAG: hypothetical protein ACJ77K_15435 [Bacteroidia bacterium]
MQLLLPAIFLLLFIFLIRMLNFFSSDGLSKSQFIGLFLIKCFAGACVWFVYTYYYPGSDLHLYFDSSHDLMHHLFSGTSGEISAWNGNFEDAFYLNSRLVIVTNVFLHLISFNNIFVHILFFCFFSFVGLTALYKAMYSHFPAKNYALVIGIFLVPSVLFWTSGIYKETLVVLFLGLIVYHTDFGLRKNYSVSQIVLTILSFLALVFTKIHVAAALVPVLLVNVLYSRAEKKRLWLSFIMIFVPMILLMYSISLVSDRLSVFKLIADRQAKAISEAKGGAFLLNKSNFICVDYYDEDALILQPDSTYRLNPGTSYLSWKPDNMRDTTFISGATDTSSFLLLYKVMPANTIVNLNHVRPDFLSVLKNTPAAIGNALLQPTLFHSHNLLQMFAAIENLWLLLLIVLTLIFFDIKLNGKKEVLLFCLLFAIFQLIMIGLTTPAIGAIVRYKSTALLMLAPLCLSCLDLSKISRVLFPGKNRDSGTK